MSAKSNDLGCFILLGGGFFFIIVLGALSSNDKAGVYHFARERGATAGRDDGFRAGEAASVQGSEAIAEREAFQEGIERASASGDYVLIPLYCAVIAVVAFSIGFASQFVFFYFLRRFGLLADVDRILLPKSSTIVKLPFTREEASRA